MTETSGSLCCQKGSVKVETTNEPVLGLALNTNKAGMENVDKKKVEEVILEASKNSKFYQNELRKAAEIDKQVQDLVSKQKSITSSDLEFARQEVQLQMELIERQRDLTHFVVHVDMDAFYAAVEERDCPQYKSIPLAVGSNSMLSTSNYVARKYGVRAAMPGFIAKKLCPQLTIVTPDFSKYQAASSQVQDVFRLYDLNFQMMSLDEAYLDFTQHMIERECLPVENRTFSILQSDGGTIKECIFGTDIEQAVLELRQRVFTKTKLTCSAGIAANCLLAKVCSDKNKPNGQFYLRNDRIDVTNFMAHLPIRSINGIGKVTESILKALGVNNCGEMFEKRNELFLLFSKSAFQYFLRVALGVGAIPDPEADGKSERKSMSCERTFKPVSNKEELLSIIQELCSELSHDLRKSSLYGQSLTLKVKLSSFEVKTRAIMLPCALHDPATLYKFSAKILDRFLAESSSGLSVRLIGVRMAKFARKGTVSSVKRSVGKNTVPLDKFLASSKKVEVSGQAVDLKTADVVSSSHLPPLLESGHVVDPQEVYSCNLFDASEDIENKNSGVVLSLSADRGQDDDEDVGNRFESKSEKQNTKVVTPCIKSSNAHNGGKCFEKVSTTKRSVHFNLESANPDLTQSKVSTSSNEDLLVTKHCTNRERNSTISNADVICPICGQKVPTKSDVNEHIDNCLTMIEVRNVLKEQSGLSNSSKSRIVASNSGSPDPKSKAEKRLGTKGKDSRQETSKKRRRLKYDDHKGELQSSLSDFLSRN